LLMKLKSPFCSKARASALVLSKTVSALQVVRLKKRRLMMNKKVPRC